MIKWDTENDILFSLPDQRILARAANKLFSPQWSVTRKKNPKGEQKYAGISFMKYINYWMNCLRPKSSCLRNNAKKISIRSKLYTDIRLNPYQVQKQNRTRSTVQGGTPV